VTEKVRKVCEFKEAPPPPDATVPCGPGALHYRDFTITPRHTHTHTHPPTHPHTHTYSHARARSRVPLDKWSALRRDLYLTTHNTHRRRTSLRPAGFEPAIPVSERPQTHTLRPPGSADFNINNIYFCPKLATKASSLRYNCLYTTFVSLTENPLNQISGAIRLFLMSGHTSLHFMRNLCWVTQETLRR